MLPRSTPGVTPAWLTAVRLERWGLARHPRASRHRKPVRVADLARPALVRSVGISRALGSVIET